MSRRAPEPEPIVTEAMIDAGVAAYDEFLGSYDVFSLVAEVYKAMALAIEHQHPFLDQGLGDDGANG